MDQKTGETSTTTSGITSMQDKLLALLARYRAYQQEFLAETTPEEQAASGEPDHWSLKDHFAHINFWQGESLHNLRAAVSGETREDTSDFQPINERVFAEHQQAAWADLLADSQRLSDEFAGVIGQFTDEQWLDPNRYPWRKGPLVTGTINSFYEHPIEHFAQLYRERGNAAKEQTMREDSVQVIGEIFGHSEPYGNALYNLGCFYALHGAPEQAIAAVRQSLALNPTLVEWSKQDTDLDSLRDLPAFQALYTA